jgi:hypothetical protein
MYCNKYGLEIYQTVSIPDSHGDPQEVLQEVKTNINCDMQPYSTEKLQKDYGFNIEVTKRVFMDLDINIVDLAEKDKKTLILKDGDISYEIRKIIPWDNYMEVMCYGV